MTEESAECGLQDMEEISNQSIEMSNTTGRSSVLDLPYDILSDVFADLQLEDRKNVRLTCSHFYQACNAPHILKNEQITFYDNINTGNFISAFCHSERKMWNIRLNEIKLEPSMLAFFSKHGDRIHSLIFYKCSLERGMLKDIILKCCQNLQSLAIIYILEVRYGNFSNRLIWSKPIRDLLVDFAELGRDEIACTKVTNFTLILHTPVMWSAEMSSVLRNNKFHRIFSIFPNIKELDVRVNIDRHFDQFSSNDSDIISNKVFSYSCIHYQVMKMRDQLEKLSLHFLCDLEDSYFPVKSWSHVFNIEMQKLQQLSVNLIGRRMSDISLINHSAAFTNLTRLECTVLYPSSDNIVLILNTASKLRYLTIRCHHSAASRLSSRFCSKFLEMSVECFRALVTSRLIIFEFTLDSRGEPGIRCDNLDRSLSNMSLSPNCTLKQLKVTIVDNYSLSLFCEYFQGLEYLQMEELLENTLDIVNNRATLKCLKLGRWSGLSNVSSPSLQIGASSYQFENLTHLFLQLESYEKTSAQLFLMLSQISLPKLKALSIERSDGVFSPKKDQFEIFWQSIKKYTQLEYLWLDFNYRIEHDQWVSLLKVMPRLRHIFHNNWFAENVSNSGTDEIKHYLLERFGGDDLKYRQLFDLYPSLRTVFVQVDYYCVKYFRDISKNYVIFDWLEINDSNKYQGIPFFYYNYVPHYVPAYTEETRGYYKTLHKMSI